MEELLFFVHRRSRVLNPILCLFQRSGNIEWCKEAVITIKNSCYSVLKHLDARICRWKILELKLQWHAKILRIFINVKKLLYFILFYHVLLLLLLMLLLYY